MFRDQRRYGRDPSVVVRAAAPTFYAPQRAKKWAEQAEQIRAEEGRRMRVFTCSWSDFFHPDADEWREEAWDVIRACPQYDWQILTKRPELVRERLPADWGAGWPHVWLGVSIENRRFVGRADVLRELPAAVRFISGEPLLGPLVHDAGGGPVRLGIWRDAFDGPELDLTGIDWLIVGGESGPKHRPMREEWVRDLRDAALATRSRSHVEYGEGHRIVRGPVAQIEEGTAFFFKQRGGARPGGARELDGREWSEFPRSPAAVAA